MRVQEGKKKTRIPAKGILVWAARQGLPTKFIILKDFNN